MIRTKAVSYCEAVSTFICTLLHKYRSKFIHYKVSKLSSQMATKNWTVSNHWPALSPLCHRRCTRESKIPSIYWASQKLSKRRQTPPRRTSMPLMLTKRAILLNRVLFPSNRITDLATTSQGLTKRCCTRKHFRRVEQKVGSLKMGNRMRWLNETMWKENLWSMTLSERK